MDFEQAIDTGAVSLGGVVVGLSIVVWYSIRWWKTTKHDWKDLVFPFVPLLFFGMLLILSAGGWLGNTASFALWGSNHVGKVALEQGVGGSDTDATRSTNLVLENGGHAVVILFAVAYVAVLVFSPATRSGTKGEGWIRKIILIVRLNLHLVLPVIAGICLGLSGGLAGAVANILAPAVDTLGGFVAGVAN